ncbi:Hypothetical predicted protein [Mytilus galloprovincialis]|uniref:Uncharacterized protein n=1 Tax=Mytilus galloprovincialis TaxID=29158 RepID=A0A8B6DFP4_MYTGA|nr:Hypothetical predicted protein [Mytilus galloprovincialis]
MDRTSDEDSHCCKNPIVNEQRIPREDGPSHLRFSEKFLRSLDLFSSIEKTVDITPDEDTTNLTFRPRVHSFPQTAKRRNNKEYEISEEVNRLGLTAEPVYDDKNSEIDENESNLDENNDSRFSTGYAESELFKDSQYSRSRKDNYFKEKNSEELNNDKLGEYGHFDILDSNDIADIPFNSTTSTALQNVKNYNIVGDTKSIQVYPENEQCIIDLEGHITTLKHHSNTSETYCFSKDQKLSNVKTLKNKTNTGSKHVKSEHRHSGKEDTSFQKQTLQWVSTTKVRQSGSEQNMLSQPTF